MPKNFTKYNKYTLPHPENIAKEDVVVIKNAIEKIDEDMESKTNDNTTLAKRLRTLKIENFLKLWS